MELIIERPSIRDKVEIEKLFAQTLTDNFKREGIYQFMQDALTDEIASLCNTLQSDFDSDGQENYFLIAKMKDRIIGTIAFGTPNEIIQKHVDVSLLEVPEIKCVYVLPEFHKIGVGSRLVTAMHSALQQRNYKQYCLDCGYTIAQGFWKKQLGAPRWILSNYWQNNSDHLIWLVNL